MFPEVGTASPIRNIANHIMVMMATIRVRLPSTVPGAKDSGDAAAHNFLRDQNGNGTFFRGGGDEFFIPLTRFLIIFSFLNTVASHPAVRYVDNTPCQHCSTVAGVHFLWIHK